MKWATHSAWLTAVPRTPSCRGRTAIVRTGGRRMHARRRTTASAPRSRTTSTASMRCIRGTSTSTAGAAAPGSRFPRFRSRALLHRLRRRPRRPLSPSPTSSTARLVVRRTTPPTQSPWPAPPQQARSTRWRASHQFRRDHRVRSDRCPTRRRNHVDQGTAYGGEHRARPRLPHDGWRAADAAWESSVVAGGVGACKDAIRHSGGGDRAPHA